jgi:hypothetical protein
MQTVRAAESPILGQLPDSCQRVGTSSAASRLGLSGNAANSN